MKRYIFLTTVEIGWQKTWVILLDENKHPFTSFNNAKNYCRKNLSGIYTGLAKYEQMKKNNAAWDNF